MKLLVVLLTAVSAFSPLRMQEKRAMVSARQLFMASTLLSEIDSMCVINAAGYCVQEECTVDEREALMNRLQEQSKIVETRVREITDLIATLSPRPRAVFREHLQGTAMSDIDLMCIMNAASFTGEEACGLEEKESLLNRLSQQSAFLLRRYHDMEALSRRLRVVNRPDEQDVDSLMRSIQSVLSMDFEAAHLTEERVVSGSFL